MKRCFAVFSTAALALFLVSCTETAATTNTDADVKALKDNEAQWNQDFASKDASKLASHYTEDAVLMNPGAPAAKGKAAIQKSFTEMVADPAFNLKFEADRVEVSKSGDLGYTQGHYTMTITDPATKKPINDHGSYVTFYKKQDGAWKAVQDAAISEVPPPAPPPASKK